LDTKIFTISRSGDILISIRLSIFF